MLEHHPFVKEFPEHADLIHKLKEEDNHFKKLFNEYDEMDKHIFRIESEQEIKTDDEIRILKKERRRIKDMLYNQILKSKSM